MTTLDALVTGDDPTAWAAAGFTVVDDRIRIDGVAVACVGDGAGHDRWQLRASEDSAIPDLVDGIATTVATAALTGDGDRPQDPAHANGVTGFDHLVVRSPDLDRTTEAFGAIGLEARRTRDATMGDQAIRQRFFWLGDVVLELVGTPHPTGDGPATIWGVALVCDDLDASAALLGERCSSPKTAVQPGRRIATLRTRDLGIGMAVALMTPHVPRGGPDAA